MANGIGKGMGFFVLLVLVGLATVLGHRIAVSYYVANLVDIALDNIDNEKAFIHEIRMSRFFGLNGIDEIVIRRNAHEDSNPLLVMHDLGVFPDWVALMKGHRVADVTLGFLEINLLRSDFKRIRTTVDKHESRVILDVLTDAPINTLAVKNAVITFYDATRNPPASIYIENIALQANNVVVGPDGNSAPATASLTARTAGGGKLSIYGWLALAQEQPAITFDIALEHMNLADLSKFIEAYASVEVESGIFNLWSHLSLADQQLDGFVDQTIEHLQMESLEKPEDLFSRQFGAMLLQSIREDSDGNFSGTVNIRADLAETPSGVVSDTGRLLKLAFMRLFNLEEGESVTAQDLSS